MDYGIALVPSPDSWKTVQRAEELGFTHAWFYDSQLLYSDIFACMALCAEHTSRIKLGTGVLIPTNRIAPIAASAFGTLNQMAPGRIIFGVGTGYTGRNTMGLKAMPLRAMREYMRVVKALMAGETVNYWAEGADRPIRFLHPGLGFVNQADPVPIHVSAFGPKGLQLTIQDADGWMTFSGVQDAAIAQLRTVQQQLAAAGRAPDSLYKTVFFLGCVLGEGEDAESERALLQAGPSAVGRWHGAMERWDSLPDAARAGFATERALFESYRKDAPYMQLHTGHLVYVREDERPFVTGDLIRRATFTGSETELRARAGGLASAGYDQLCIQLIHGQEAAIEDWARVFGLG